MGDRCKEREMEIARHYETIAAQVVDARIAKEEVEARGQLELLEPEIEKAANNGEFELTYYSQLNDSALSLLRDLGYGVGPRPNENTFTGEIKISYVITWKGIPSK